MKRRSLAPQSVIENLEARCLLSVLYTIQDLGGLAGGPGNFDASVASTIEPLSMPFAISQSGQVVGWSYTSTGEKHAFSWQSGTGMTDLAGSAGGESSAFAVNAKGQIVGELSAPDGNQIAFLYSGTAYERLGSIFGGSSNSALGINDNGEIVGTATDSNGITHAFLYDGNNFFDLGTSPGSAFSASAWQITNSGLIASDIWNPTDRFSNRLIGGPVTNEAGVTADSPNTGKYQGVGIFSFHGTESLILDSGDFQWSRRMSEMGINNQNIVVGYKTSPGAGLSSLSNVAFVTDGSVVKDLNTLIPPESGWVLHAATAINDAGQIVGWGEHNGQARAFLLNPTPGTKPPPAFQDTGRTTATDAHLPRFGNIHAQSPTNRKHHHRRASASPTRKATLMPRAFYGFA